ncbi:hypothetical protein SAMN05216359_106182 [Roseateles sp. YR242]|nr:hypothetical protein SAMN05216359_106182 [Roseateles sp. YR242]
MGLGALFGGLLVCDLRVLGWRRELDAKDVVRLAVPLALAGFAVCLVTGACMFATQPWELWINGAFRLKMVLILLAGANAAWFHWRGGVSRHDRMARAQCWLSLGIWLAVIICGRWIGVV